MFRFITSIALLLLVSTTLVAQTFPNIPKNIRGKKVINKNNKVNSIADFDGTLSVNEINAKSCDAFKKVSNYQFSRTLNKLLRDGISVEEEDAFMKMHNCFDCEKHKQTFIDLDLARSYFEADGRPPSIVRYANKATRNGRQDYARKERVYNKIYNCLSTHLIMIASDRDGGAPILDYEFELLNPKRTWLHTAGCETIINKGENEVMNAISELFKGSTLDTDEGAILKAIKCFDQCYKRKNIIEGVGKAKLEEEIHGEEYDELKQIFKNCRIVSTQSDEVSSYLINRLSCRDLSRYNDDDIFHLINTLIQGSTTNQDEQDILKLLNCLPNQKAKKVIRRVGLQTIKNNFHGSEYDKLKVLLFRLELISMIEFDKPAVVELITTSNCRTFHELSLSRLKALLRLLFNGTTGNTEERAINKLIECLPSTKLDNLLREPGFSVDDFDSEVDGAEWDQLVRIFTRKGVRF